MYILASGSPRRRELLSYIIPEYKCEVSGCEEFVPEGTPIERVPALLAEQKALSVAEKYPNDTVIGSDTIVVLNGKIYGKPKGKADAHRMLRALSGRTHTVLTGVAVAENGTVRSFVKSTEVEFYELSDEFIDRYIETGDPMDKAGSYGIQGKGAPLVKGITGDYFNVMGFPIAEAARFLGLI